MQYYLVGWRKVLEANEYGKIDRIIWYDQEAIVVTGQGRRVRALRYADGLELWQLAAASTTNSNQDTSIKHCQVVKNRFDPGNYDSIIIHIKKISPQYLNRLDLFFKIDESIISLRAKLFYSLLLK